MIAALVLSGVIQSAAAAQTPPKVILEAHRPTGHKLICELQPKPFRAAVSVGPGAGWTVSPGCGDFEGKGLVPLLLTVKNPHASREGEFTIPRLSDVTQPGTGGSQSAVALYMPWHRPQGFATDVRGDVIVILKPSTDIELLYLLPAAASNATSVAIKGHGILTIAKPRPQEPFTVRAVVLDFEGKPISGEDVYCLVYQDGKAFYQMALVDDRFVPAGPRGKSDAGGNVLITVDSEFLRKGPTEFSLGSVRNGKVVNVLKDGRPFYFALEDARKAGNDLDIGKVTPGTR